MRKGCRSSKYEKKCQHYSYALYRCTLGKVPAICNLIEQPKPGSKADKKAQAVREFYGKDFTHGTTKN